MRKTRPRLPFWWLSFAGDEGFRGVVILRARGPEVAITISHRLGINPGGEVQLVGLEADTPFDPDYIGRLLTRADCDRLNSPEAPTRPGDPPLPPMAD